MLQGRKIAITEHRFERELIMLIERQGGEVISCPLLEESLVKDLPQLDAFVHKTIDPGFDTMVFFTGVGFRFLHERSVGLGLGPSFLEALGRTDLVARGPKPLSAMRKAGVKVDRVPDEATSEGLLELLSSEDLSGRRIGVQLYGVPNPRFCDGLEQRGATVETVQVYDYQPVSDAAAVRRFIELLVGGEIDAVTFTSGPQVYSLFGHADQLGVRDSLVRAMNERVVVVAIGYVTNRALEACGVPARVIPTTPKMGPMVETISTYFDQAQP